MNPAGKCIGFRLKCSKCRDIKCSTYLITAFPIFFQALINDTAKSKGYVQLGLDVIFIAEKVTIFHKLTVKEVLFGYNDTLLLFLQQVEDNPMVKNFLDYLKKHDPALAAKIPNLNPFIQLQVGGSIPLIISLNLIDITN